MRLRCTVLERRLIYRGLTGSCRLLPPYGPTPHLPDRRCNTIDP